MASRPSQPSLVSSDTNISSVHQVQLAKRTSQHVRMNLPSLLNLSLEDIGNGLDRGLYNAVHLVKAYQARIREVDEEFRSVLEINEDAEQIATALDKERELKGRRGPLHGVPILLKDNISTLDKTNTTAGSFALLGARTAREASVVTKLREAGVILLGKANMSEWANFRSTNGSDGWSPRGGQTLGAYYPGSSPEGSSSGPAVATALGLTFAALGSETDGSIVCPAEYNNVVGIKPTIGLVPRDGVIPMSESQDSVGPMARTVKDAATILTVIAGQSEFDKYTWSIPFKIPDYARECISTGLSNVRIGIPRNAIRDVPESVLQEFEVAMSILREAGAIVVDNADFSSLSEWDAWDVESRNLQSKVHFEEAIENYCKHLLKNPNGIHDLGHIVEFTKTTPEEDYPSRDIGWWLGKTSTSLDIQEAIDRMVRISGKEGILGALQLHNLDVLAVPSTPNPPVTFAARAGLPIITVPLGFYPPDTRTEYNDRGDLIQRAPGMPFSISFFGKAFSEPMLIRVAYAFEQLTLARLKGKPHRIPRTELQYIIEASMATS